jgi:hypothetical protein
MPRSKLNRVREVRNRKQRGWRARLRANEIRPHITVAPEVIRALLASGRLDERTSKDRGRVSEACAVALREWAENQRLRSSAK